MKDFSGYVLCCDCAFRPDDVDVPGCECQHPDNVVGDFVRGKVEQQCCSNVNFNGKCPKYRVREDME